MSRRFVLLGLLALLGIGLLVAGWREGDLKEVTGRTKSPVDQTAPEKQGSGGSLSGEQGGATEGMDKACDELVKPDNKPSGPAVQVQEENNSQEASTGVKGSGFFVEYRLERERSRGYQIQLLREIINNTNSDGESRKKAQDQLYVISNNLQKELEVESLIRAKGYQDAVVFLEGKTVTVVIQAKTLSQEDAIKITDLVSRSTGVGAQNIVIIPKM